MFNIFKKRKCGNCNFCVMYMYPHKNEQGINQSMKMCRAAGANFSVEEDETCYKYQVAGKYQNRLRLVGFSAQEALSFFGLDGFLD
jgi:hypothetical protein